MSGNYPLPESVRLVQSDYGGEGPFYVAYLRRRVAGAVRRRFRELAANDPLLQADLDSVEQPGAVEDYRTALELRNYLTPDSPLSEEESITALSLAPEQRTWVEEGEPPPRVELRQLVRDALFDLLREADIEVDAYLEVPRACEALAYVAGPDAVERFARLNQWLEAMRRRTEESRPPALVRTLCWLAPDLFARDGDHPATRLSFRLYLRDRLHTWCEQVGLRPTGQKYQTLTEAFAALDRDRIGELVRAAAVSAEWPEPVVAEAAVSWLHAAP